MGRPILLASSFARGTLPKQVSLLAGSLNVGFLLMIIYPSQTDKEPVSNVSVVASTNSADANRILLHDFYSKHHESAHESQIQYLVHYFTLIASLH